MAEREPGRWLRLRDALVRLRQQAVQDSGDQAVVVRTAVVTDSAAALPAEWSEPLLADGRLTVVPMPVMVGDEIYGEGDDDIARTLSVALAAGSVVKTSRPSPGQFEQAYRVAQDRGFESVVSIHISADLSGTSDAARLAAGRVGIPVEVLDSRTVGMAQGMGVQAAVASAGQGAAAPESVRAAQECLDRTKVYFYVPSLEQLRRGGRIGTAASVLGTMLAIKPILAVDGGKIVPVEKVRSAARAVARLEEIAAADVKSRPPGAARIAVHHFGNQAEARQLAERLAEQCGGCPAPQLSSLPAVLAAHAGLGVLAVVVGERGHSEHLST
ncbi:DegV family protein [Arthrobacter sp. M4]|uniref:DegV family protein n=1 Tax=Arthrobacter sp. M4 TaxID=218160 RepID=UPI001CDB77D9|nr:DegV family protein [Arthrobacter sp. M4]MCA4131383.1 DegV family protein [Arthrobacter sp. M4]